MLKSKFDKDPSKFCAQKIFTDRKVPSQVLADNLLEINDIPLKIITYYGKGGIGKTRLLKELYSNLKNNSDIVPGITFHPVFISVDAYDYANPINILIAIRNTVKADCALFDYAMTLYCAKAKLNFEDIKDKNWNLSSNVIEHINDILSLVTLNATIPLKWINSAINAIKEQSFKAKYQKEVQLLSTLTEFEIFERLPYYLGLCLRQASICKKCVHVLFFDSYESLLIRTFSQTPSVECDEWLRELFLSSGQLRLVIATRDKLKWEVQNPEWSSYLDQHLLNNLSDEDARWFLEQVPIKNEKIIDYIVGNSKGIPLYLDMCVDVYESLFNIYGESLDIELFQEQGSFYSTRGKVIIERYLRHLTAKQHDAVKILSVLHSFNRTFAMKLLQQMGLAYYHDELSALLDKSIILPINDSSDIWKVDESIREQIWNCLSEEVQIELLNGVLTITAADTKGHFFSYFAIVLEHIIANPKLANNLMEMLLEQVEIYANGGFWNELHGLLSSQVDNTNEQIQSIAVIGETICLRRFGYLKEASSILVKHPLSEKILGHFYYYYSYLKANISHLQGNYDQAIKSYAALIEKMELIKGSLPVHIYIQAILKHTDLLMLKGQFEKALEQIDKILFSGNSLSVTDQVEALRIKGHVYRFMQKFDKARTIYEYAMDLVRDSNMKASVGKLYTNYVEANCFDCPAQAVTYLLEAIEYNHDNDIELTKCYAAASIAWCRQKDLLQAEQYASLSYSKAQLSGYRSGMIFALAAKALLDYSLANESELQSDLSRMDSLSLELGVYQFIPLQIKQLCTV